MARFVISNVPTKLPITSTVLYSFLLYYFNVDNIWWGIFITLYSIFWITAIYFVIKEEKVDVFNLGKKDENPVSTLSVKTRFQERMDDALKARELQKQWQNNGDEF